MQRAQRKPLKNPGKMGKNFEGLVKVEKEHHDNYQETLDSFDNAKKKEFKESNLFLKKNS